jgi:hypothetical protein
MGGSLGRPGDSEVLGRRRKLANGVDSRSSAVKVWSTRNKEILWSSSRRWLGRRRSEAVDLWQALTDDADGGEKWLPESLAIGSSSMVLLHPQRMKAERLSNLDRNGRAS